MQELNYIRCADYYVGDDLVFRRLLDEADPGGLSPWIELWQRRPFKENVPLLFSVGREDGLQLAQERGFSAAGRAAEDQKFPPAQR